MAVPPSGAVRSASLRCRAPRRLASAVTAPRRDQGVLGLCGWSDPRGTGRGRRRLRARRQQLWLGATTPCGPIVRTPAATSRPASLRDRASSTLDPPTGVLVTAWSRVFGEVRRDRSMTPALTPTQPNSPSRSWTCGFVVHEAAGWSGLDLRPMPTIRGAERSRCVGVPSTGRTTTDVLEIEPLADVDSGGARSAYR